MSRSHSTGLCLLLLAVALLPSARLAWGWPETPQLGHFHDDGIYWLAARSLAQGEGYRIVSLPEQPAQTKYPPLYPWWLSLAWRLDPAPAGNLKLATLLNWLQVGPLLGLSWLVYRELGIAALPASGLAVFIGANPYLCFLSITPMAEVQFTALALASLLLAGRAARPGAACWVAAAAGALGGAAYLSKAVGLALLASAPAGLLLRRRWGPAAWYAGGMLPGVAAWNWWVRAHLPAATDVATLYYQDYLGFQFHNVTAENFARVVWQNLSWLATGVSSLLVFESGEGAGGTAWGVPLCVVLAAGAWHGLKRLAVRSGAQQYPAFAAALCALLLGWHYPPNMRFVFPLLPLLAAGAAAELWLLGGLLRAGWKSGRRGERAVAVVMGAAGAALLGWTAQVTVAGVWRALPWILEEKRELARKRLVAYRWIEANTAPTATFLAFNDPLLTLHTGRRGCRLPIEPRWIYEGNRGRLVEPLLDLPGFMRRRGLDYLLITDADYERDLTDAERSLVAERARESPELERLWEGRGMAVYRLRRLQGPEPARGPLQAGAPGAR